MAGAYVAKPDAEEDIELPPGWDINWPYPGPLPPGYEYSPDDGWEGNDGENWNPECFPACGDYSTGQTVVATASYTSAGCACNIPECTSEPYNWPVAKAAALALVSDISSKCNSYNSNFLSWCGGASGGDDYYTAMQSDSDDANSYAAAQIAILAGVNGSTGYALWGIVMSVVKPWSDRECRKIPPSWFEGSRGPIRCRKNWVFQYRIGAGPWNTIATGTFTPSGVPYATSLSIVPWQDSWITICCGGNCNLCDIPPGTCGQSTTFTYKIYTTSSSGADEQCQ